MKPAPPDPAEILHRVRQQLILAQARIMELEDARDETGSRLADAEKLLGAAQTLADQKLDEAAHAESMRTNSETQFVRLQQDHCLTIESLESTRAQFRDVQQKLETALRETADRELRLVQLDSELRALKSTRSWRWTAWLRSIGGKNS